MVEEVKIWHTASAGIVIDIGKNCFGIDVFSKDPEGLYPDTPKELREEVLKKIEAGEIPTLLFTHGHGDHFSLEAVLEALKRNPRLVIISTEEVIQRIRAVEPARGEMKEIPAAEKGLIAIELPGFSLKLFNCTHMGAQYEGVQNLAVLIDCDGRKIFVPGDGAPERKLFARTAQWSETIDLMAAPFPLVGLPSVRRSLVKDLHIKNILAFHLPRPEKDLQGWYANARNVCQASKDILPMPIFAEKLGCEYRFELDESSMTAEL